MATSLYKMFKTDEKVEKEGVWLEYGTGEKPIRIRIARAGGGNMRYLKVLEAKTRPLRRLIQNDSLELPKQEEVMREVFAECIVLGWENVTLPDATGNEAELPFNKQNCVRLFEALPDLFADIREQATKSALFRADIREVAASN